MWGSGGGSGSELLCADISVVPGRPRQEGADPAVGHRLCALRHGPRPRGLRPGAAPQGLLP